jgi:hypothetical protein
MEKLLESRTGFFRIAKVVFIYFSDREKRVETILAARVFLAQESILPDSATQNLAVVELAAHFDHQLGGSDHAGIGFRGSRCAEVHAPVSINYALVRAAGPIVGRAPIESLAHALGGGKLLAGPGIAMANPSRGRQGQRRQQRQ